MESILAGTIAILIASMIPLVTSAGDDDDDALSPLVLLIRREIGLAFKDEMVNELADEVIAGTYITGRNAVQVEAFCQLRGDTAPEACRVVEKAFSELAVADAHDQRLNSQPKLGDERSVLKLITLLIKSHLEEKTPAWKDDIIFLLVSTLDPNNDKIKRLKKNCVGRKAYAFILQCSVIEHMAYREGGPSHSG